MPTQRPMKRYTIHPAKRYRSDYDRPRSWYVYDHQLGDVIEGGYTKRGATDAAAFHNFKALGHGPWRPYRKPRAQ